jgi:hypothetical protein
VAAAAVLIGGLIAGGAATAFFAKKGREKPSDFPEEQESPGVARERARRAAMDRRGSGSTILTLGNVGEANTARATLLGGS